MSIEDISLSRRKALILSMAVAGLPLANMLTSCTPTKKAADVMPLIRDIAERIIPRTDTPGATDAKVAEYISMLLSDWFTKDEADAFIKSLNIFDKVASKAGELDYMSAADKDDLLIQLDNDGDEAFVALKKLVVFGFYTSEAAQQDLQYDPTPSEYNGCLTIEEVGNAWMTHGI